MVDVVTQTPETLFNDDFPELETLSDEARILCVDRNTNTNLMEGYQAPLSLLKWDKGDKGDTWAKWETGERWPRGYQWETWDKGDKGDKWDTWLQWPQWEKGDPWQDGINWADGQQWPAWNWIAGMTSSKNGKVTTITFEYTQWGSDSFQVQDWADGAWGGWDVTWPSSSTNDRIAVFNGITWKAIKDWGSKISDLQTKLVSGTNIKTVNNNSLLGSGNITISGGTTYTAGTGIDITGTTISTTLATKTFKLSSTSDLTNASKAYAWYNLWNTPFIQYDGEVYSFQGYSGWQMTFYTIPSESVTSWNSTSYLKLKWLTIAISAGIATSITATGGQIIKYLDTNVDYSTPYTPTYDGSPATKKYVDDNIGSGGITNNTTGTTTTVTQIWAWTQTQYNNLGSYSNSTIYYVF